MKTTTFLLLFYFLFTIKYALAENPNDFLSFTTDFAAKCVTRGGVMIYLSNTHPSRKIKVVHLQNAPPAPFSLEESSFGHIVCQSHIKI